MAYLGRTINDVTLELGLRPFRDISEAGIRSKAREIFMQWLPLVRHADGVSVMMWASDGSEILEYRGDMSAEFEWSHTVGVANPRGHMRPVSDPNHLNIHQTPRDYIPNPPALSYGWYRRFLEILKEVGTEVFGKTPRLGATFDPGPEFAKSKFKYEKHLEICLASTMGKESFVVCYATLHKDEGAYAGFPKGIPEGTSFGTFLGGQSQHFLTDMGFDFLWLSNGFGFGMETWGMYGAVFNGKAFEISQAADVRGKCLNFWKDFRAQCPDLLLRTRGTNQTTGRDLACDGVPLDEIIHGGFNMEPPPNSPWAALNGDFGLELAGWMSHVAEIPGKTFPFRFYTHDIWFANSPWIDRYGREPHDIFLPLSVSRIDGDGNMSLPTGVNLLSVDSTYGETPDLVPNEVIPHFLECLGSSPDRPGLLTWLYPWDEYHRDSKKEDGIGEVFFGDWFIRSSLAAGMPLNTVISTRSYRKTAHKKPELFAGTILVTPFPRDEDLAGLLLNHVKKGGQVLLYGPVTHGAPSLVDCLGMKTGASLSGPVTLSVEGGLTFPQGPMLVEHVPMSSGGGLDVLGVGAQTTVTARVRQGNESRIYAVSQKHKEGGHLAWVRGTNSFELPEFKGSHLPNPRSPLTHAVAERLMRETLELFGVGHRVHANRGTQKDPVLTVHRHQNAFYFTGYSPNTNVSQSFSMPWGAPLFTGREAELVGGRSHYHMGRAWRRECRVFVKQKGDSEMAVVEQPSGMVGVKRRLRVKGLEGGDLVFFPVPGSSPTFLLDPQDPYLAGNFLKPEKVDGPHGPYYTIPGLGKDLLISW